MGCDLDMENPKLSNSWINGGKWYQELTNVDGYRQMLSNILSLIIMLIGFWIAGKKRQKIYLWWENDTGWSAETQEEHPRFFLKSRSICSMCHCITISSEASPLPEWCVRDMGRKSVQVHWLLYQEDYVMTFVDNHDTQVGQEFGSHVVMAGLKWHAYALILLRKLEKLKLFSGDLFRYSWTRYWTEVGTFRKISWSVTKSPKEISWFISMTQIGIGWAPTGGDFEYWTVWFGAVVMTNAQGKAGERNDHQLHSWVGETYVGYFEK